MEFIDVSFHSVSFLLALLAASILLLLNKERKHSNRILAFILIILAFQSLMNIFITTRLVFNVPWLLRFFAPFTFLVGPFLYIYIRSVLNDELKFKKSDRLLFIPAVLVLINFIPFYLLSNADKIDYLEQNFFNKTSGQDSGKGYVPCLLYNIIRICWSGIFVFIGYILIYRFYKSNDKEIVSKNKTLLNWLFTFNSLLAGIFIVLILKVFIPTIRSTNITIADIILGATIFYICLSLFIRPQILYGVYNPLPEIAKTDDKIIPEDFSLTSLKHFPNDNDIIAAQNQHIKYREMIETQFNENNHFLNSEYSLNHLVSDTHIPRHILSAFINRQYGMSFREFLNRKKIEYIIANHDKTEWKQYTLEAIALECGYTSRTTFIKNFKEITGKTPSDYFKKTVK